MEDWEGAGGEIEYSMMILQQLNGSFVVCLLQTAVVDVIENESCVE